MANKIATVVLVLSLSTVATFLNYSKERTVSVERRLATTSNEDEHLYASNALPKYDQSTIELFVATPYHSFHTSLLVFDGHYFLSYDIGSKVTSWRSVNIVPLLVNALRTSFPDRFQPGQPVFQLPWTAGDFVSTECVNEDKHCSDAKDLPPIISFGSTYKDEQILPTVKGFPNPYMLGCMYKYKFSGASACHWGDVDQSLAWDELIPTIIWRGTDFRHFLHAYKEHSEYYRPWIQDNFTKESMVAADKATIVDKLFIQFRHLTPRWKAIAYTLRAKVSGGHPWIDCMFTGSHQQEDHLLFAEGNLPVTDSKHMHEIEMSKYRYQIDLGGGGGTTWQGTLTKLQMPGVLFHHETKTKEWFYDLMEPWKHYIPVNEDLSDLYSRYRWAEENQEKAKNISEEATKLAAYLLSSEYMEHLFDEFFVDYLGKVVDAYQPEEGKSWDDCLERYELNKIGIHMLSQCDELECNTQWAQTQFLILKHSTRA